MGTQRGSALIALYAAIGAVGVLGATSMTIMKGPVRSMHNVTQRTIAENSIIASSKLAVITATSQAGGGDCDGDGSVEPVAWNAGGSGPKPIGGGYLPANIGAGLQDPWGNQYGYCVWDHGSKIQNGCATPTQRLKGDASGGGPVVAVMSAGPDKIFQTTCADAPAYLTRVPGSDDIVLTYTYGEASTMSAGLWSLKPTDSATAEIGKNLEVKNAASNVVFGVDSTSDAAKPSIKADYVKALNNAKVEFLSSLLAGAGLEVAAGGNAYYGWGNVGYGTLPAGDIDLTRPNMVANHAIYRINNHTGLSLSAHSQYGGIRFYNQGYSGSDAAATYKSANGASMVMAITNGNVGIGTETPQAKLDVMGQVVGGFGAVTTAGTNDWNHVSNTRSGNGYTLLRSAAFSANGPPEGNYFHAFNFEYTTKDGSGQITQLAIPYGDSGSIPYGIFIRGRYTGTWTAWKKLGDDLGNHTATTNLNLGANAIVSNVGTIRDAGGGWIRTYGDTGWYSQTYGGGWYMTDTSWLRAYGGKNIYTPGQMQAGSLNSPTTYTNTICNTSGTNCVSQGAIATAAAGGGSAVQRYIVTATAAGSKSDGDTNPSCYVSATCPSGWLLVGCSSGQYGTYCGTSPEANGAYLMNSSYSCTVKAICIK